MPYMIIMMWSQICWIFRRKYSFQRAFRPALLLYAEILRIIFRCLFNPGYCRKQLSLHRQPLQQQCFVLSFLSTSVTFIYYHHQRFLPSQRRRLRWYYGFIWLPATNLVGAMPCRIAPHVGRISPGTRMFFLTIYPPTEYVSEQLLDFDLFGSLTHIFSFHDFCSLCQWFAFRFPVAQYTLAPPIFFPLSGGLGTFTLWNMRPLGAP